MSNVIRIIKKKFSVLWIIFNLLFLLSSVSGHKQTVVSASWHQATGGLLGEVCHEQPALWQAHEPQATTSLAGQSPPCGSLCVFVSLPCARSIWNPFLVSGLCWLPSHGRSSSTHARMHAVLCGQSWVCAARLFWCPFVWWQQWFQLPICHCAAMKWLTGGITSSGALAAGKRTSRTRF